MSQPRILITGAGGPAAQALLTHERLSRLELHAGDADPLMPGFLLAAPDRRHVLPLAREANFVDATLEVCRRQGIDILWPTVDYEFIPLMERAMEFRSIGTRIISSPLSTLERVLDKAELMASLEGQIELAPWGVFDEHFTPKADGGWLLKPRRGAGSRGIEYFESRAELMTRERDPAYLAQALLPGKEYSSDLFRSSDGQSSSVVVRTRTRTDSGVSTMSEVVRDDEIESLTRAIADVLGLVGVNNVQFKRDARGTPRLLEINPRVPGGLPLSVAAGCDLPWYTYLDAMGLALPPAPEPKRVVMLRTLANHFRPVEMMPSYALSQRDELCEGAA